MIRHRHQSNIEVKNASNAAFSLVLSGERILTRENQGNRQLRNAFKNRLMIAEELQDECLIHLVEFVNQDHVMARRTRCQQRRNDGLRFFSYMNASYKSDQTSQNVRFKQLVGACSKFRVEPVDLDIA